MAETEKYCIKCESVMLLKTNNTTGAKFYSCSNWPGCKFTQTAKAATTEQTTSTDETESSSARAAIQIHNHALVNCLAQLEEMALRLKAIGPAMESLAMSQAIPGFGKMADELTDAEREQRAEYFAKRIAQVQIKPLPYDKGEWLTDQPAGKSNG